LNTQSVRTIRYLGNKRKIVPFIEAELGFLVNPGGTFIDLFAGSSAVGYQLLPNYRIISNDIETFSYCLSKALIEDCSFSVTSEEVENVLIRDYQDNLTSLSKSFLSLLNQETQFMASVHDFRHYADFCRKTPYVSNWKNNGIPTEIREVFLTISNNKSNFPYSLFSTYFMNTYFGVKQCIQLDSIRYAIDCAFGPYSSPKNEIFFYKLLAALVYTASFCVSSPGHYAQASFPNNQKISNRILKERKKDIWELFLGFIDELFRSPRHNNYSNKAYQTNALSLAQNINSIREKTNDMVVYLDPPYTSDHYSRYYHLLNTLILYDFPDCIGKGRYRQERYISPYSLKSVAKSEMEMLLKVLLGERVKVILSYRVGGLIPIRYLHNIAQKLFTNSKFVVVPYSHSAQGRKNMSSSVQSIGKSEILLVLLP
jgi:adenine-specific DNA-methyltransferase